MSEYNDQFSSMAAPTEVTSPKQPSAIAPWIGVVSIVIGVLGLFCWGSQGIMVLMQPGLASMPEGMPEKSSGHMVMEAAGYIATVLLGLILIVAGSGVMGKATWARGLLRFWAWLRLLVMVMMVIVAISWVNELVAESMWGLESEAAKQAGSGADVSNIPSLTPAAMQTIIIMFVLVQALAVSLWPIVVLVMTRSSRDAIE
jgi:hypothetical protein